MTMTFVHLNYVNCLNMYHEKHISQTLMIATSCLYQLEFKFVSNKNKFEQMSRLAKILVVRFRHLVGGSSSVGHLDIPVFDTNV